MTNGSVSPIHPMNGPNGQYVKDMPYIHEQAPLGARQKRRPSDAEEVEAGLALANMAEQAKKASPKSGAGTVNGGAVKKSKKEDGKKGDNKDNRKSCSECRRLKAKCDRVFPCSNCESASLAPSNTQR
jgi:hypothetical protein